MADVAKTSESAAIAALLKESARAEGFDLAGIAPATLGLGTERLRDWLAAGKHGEMLYMERNRAARADPNRILDGVRSILIVARAYRTSEPADVGAGEGRVSRYAWGRDYHDVLRERLLRVAATLHESHPTIRTRVAVDSAPLMERDYGRLAGLGWIGKNTLLLNRSLGSWFFLGALLLDAEIDADLAHATDHCGTCTRCLDACPTQAFDGPWQLDPRRCISYLTIEHRSTVPDRYWAEIGPWVYGCDVCQEVCPWNAKESRDRPSAAADFAPQAGLDPVSIGEWLAITEEEFSVRFANSPIGRIGRDRLVRNALMAAAERPEFRPAVESLANDSSALVCDTARGVLKRWDEPDAKVPLDDCPHRG